MARRTRRRRNVKKARKTRVKRRPKRGGAWFDTIELSEGDKTIINNQIKDCGNYCSDIEPDNFDSADSKYFTNVKNKIRGTVDVSLITKIDAMSTDEFIALFPRKP